MNKYKMTKLVLGKPSIVYRCSAFIPVFCVGMSHPGGAILRPLLLSICSKQPRQSPGVLIKFWICRGSVLNCNCQHCQDVRIIMQYKHNHGVKWQISIQLSVG